MNKPFFTARNDKVFKTILGSEDNKELLKLFLEKIIKEEIKELTFLKNELNINYPKERRKTVDLLVKTEKEFIHIELNNGYSDYLHMRNFCYFTNIYSKKTKAGEKYNLKDKFMHIDFTYGKKDKRLYRKYKVMDEEKEKYINNFEIVEYNMDKIMELWYTKSEKIEEYKHLIMLDLDKENLEKLSEGDELVEEYKKEIEELNENETYTSWLTPEEDERFILNTERSIGYEEGEKAKSLQVAKKMLDKGLSIEDIMDITNLTKNEIEKIKK